MMAKQSNTHEAGDAAQADPKTAAPSSSTTAAGLPTKTAPYTGPLPGDLRDATVIKDEVADIRRGIAIADLEVVFERNSVATKFAAALLQNPKVDQFLYGNPMEGGRRGDHESAGALLAAASLRLADDYLAERHKQLGVS